MGGVRTEVPVDRALPTCRGEDGYRLGEGDEKKMLKNIRQTLLPDIPILPTAWHHHTTCSTATRTEPLPTRTGPTSPERGDTDTDTARHRHRHHASTPQRHCATQSGGATFHYYATGMTVCFHYRRYSMCTGCPIKKATQAFGSCSRTRVPILFKFTMDIV